MSWNESALFAMFVNTALKSTAVLGAAWLVTLLLRRRSAAARHLVWTGAAAAIVALPLLAFALPAMHLPVFLAPVHTGLLFQTTVTASGAGGAASAAALAANAAPAVPAPWRPDWMLYADAGVGRGRGAGPAADGGGRCRRGSRSSLRPFLSAMRISAAPWPGRWASAMPWMCWKPARAPCR